MTTEKSTNARLLDAEAIAEIERIVKRGNKAEIKKEKDKIVVVEIKRQVKYKSSATGQS